jgi:hypothetical protein
MTGVAGGGNGAKVAATATNPAKGASTAKRAAATKPVARTKRLATGKRVAMAKKGKKVSGASGKRKRG